MSSNTILMIASGMHKKKKPFLNNSIESIYLNYGLLGLGSVLYDKGYEKVKMFQGDSKSIEDIFSEIYASGIDIKKINYPVFISVPSFFAVSWALEFINKLKDENHNLKIILGGRWVLDKNIEWCKEKFKKVDYFSLGCPDEIIDNLLEPINWGKYLSPQNYKKPFSKFYFNILNNFKEYQPVIEICRGCGRGCEFCLEKDYPVSMIKSPKEVILEAKDICQIYGTDNLNFYFQASIFNPTVKWAEEFSAFYDAYNMKFNWRFETRVDSINLDSLKLLAQAGLKVIDLGLESASICQLKRMGKSKNAEEYLSKADSLLQRMHEVGVWSKINILLYVAETKDTIIETMKWLDIRKEYIKGVSVNPLIVYLNGEKTQNFIDYIQKESGVDIDQKSLYEFGYSFIPLSNEISIEESQIISNMIFETYMSNEDYILLKNLCYTKRYTT